MCCRERQVAGGGSGIKLSAINVTHKNVLQLQQTFAIYYQWLRDTMTRKVLKSICVIHRSYAKQPYTRIVFVVNVFYKFVDSFKEDCDDFKLCIRINYISTVAAPHNYRGWFHTKHHVLSKKLCVRECTCNIWTRASHFTRWLQSDKWHQKYSEAFLFWKAIFEDIIIHPRLLNLSRFVCLEQSASEGIGVIMQTVIPNPSLDQTPI